MKRRRIKVATPYHEAGETPGRGEQIKETVVVSLLNVALPSIDVYSDLGLIIKFYIGSRYNPYCDEKYFQAEDRIDCYYDDNIPTSNLTYTPKYVWGTMMLVPFLLNYLICWYAWATTDKRKSISWIAALLSFYPQYVACKIIWQIWRDPRKGLQKKTQLQRNLIQHETFTEAVFSTLIMTYLLVRPLAGAEGSELIFNRNSGDLFMVAFSTSIICSSLGLAKNLKVGPCRILPRGLTQFILLFFACGLTLFSKGLALALTFGDSEAELGIVRQAIAVSAIFLPGFLVGLFSCCHCGLLKTFLVHPSVLLLPVFTNFTFVSNSKVCCGGRGGKKEESYLVFSPKSTAINVGVSLAGTLIYMAPLVGSRALTTVLIVLLPLSLLGIIFTLMFTFCIQCSCCLSYCCCCCEPFEFAALVTSSPFTPHILETDVESQASVVPNNIPLQPALPQLHPALPQLQAQQVWFQPAVGLSLPQFQAQQQQQHHHMMVMMPTAPQQQQQQQQHMMMMPTAPQHQYINIGQGQLALVQPQQDHLQLQLQQYQQQQALQDHQAQQDHLQPQILHQGQQQGHQAQQNHLQPQLLQHQQQALPGTEGPHLNMTPSHHMALENQYPVV